MNSQEDSQDKEQKVFYGLLVRVGALGRYQYICLAVWAVLYMVSTSTCFINPFLFYQAPYVCPDLSGEQCDSFVCSLPYQLRSPYLDKTQTTMLDKLKDYRCEGKSEPNNMQSIIYIVAILGAIATAYLSPYIRKKLLVETCLLISIFCFVMLIVVTDITAALILLCINYLSQSTITSLVILFVTENVVQQEAGNHTMILFVFYNIGSLINGVFFQMFPWEQVLCFYFITTMVLTFILLKVYVKETPFDLVTKNIPEEAFRDLHWIAIQNGNEENHLITLEEVQQIKQEYEYHLKHKKNEEFHIIDLFRYKSVRGDIICCSLLHFFIYFNYASPLLALGQFSASIYLNDIVFSGASIIASLFCYYNINEWSRKKLINYTTLASFIIIFPLYFKIICIENCQRFKLMETILIFAFRLLVEVNYQTFYLIQNEIFPTQIRSMAFLFSSFISMISNAFVPIVATLNELNHFVLAGSFVVSGIIILGTMSRVKETVGIPPPEFIQELAYKRKQAKQ